MDEHPVMVPDRPDLYDWLFAEDQEDVKVYSLLAEDCSVLLECGIGNGRIAIPLAQEGKSIYGIDNSTAMLEDLKRKLKELPETVQGRIHLCQADMRNFDLGRKFPFVYIPVATFNYLLTLEDQIACLTAIRRHLLDGGVLVMEVLSFSAYRSTWLNSSTVWLNERIIRKTARRTDSFTGKTVEVWSTEMFDACTQIIEQDRYFKMYDETGALKSEMAVKWKSRLFFIGEIQLLLKACGFNIENIYGDYGFGPYEHSSEFALIIAKPQK